MKFVWNCSEINFLSFFATRVSGDKPTVKFLKTLVPLQIESGEPARLECQIDGDPSQFTIAWLKDGEQIVSSAHHGMIKEADGKLGLLIDSFSGADVGNYQVVVTDKSGGSPITSDARVTLKQDDKQAKQVPKFLEKLQAQMDGKNLQLKCQVAPTSPFEVKWTFNGQPLVESGRVQFLVLPDGTAMLRIKDAKPGDSGLYKIEVTNSAGKSVDETKASVGQDGGDAQTLAPVLVKGLEPTLLIAEKPGQIEFQLGASTDDGVVKFLKDGQQIIPDDRVHVQKLDDGTVRLAFDKVHLDDQGNYDVVFSNQGGDVKSSGPVTVKCKLFRL